MKILFVCHRLITFILNDIIELEKLGNDVSILSFHKNPAIYNKIVLPILREHGLIDKTFIDFTRRGSRSRLVYDMLCALAQDMTRNPRRTIKCIYTLLKIFKKRQMLLVSYLETRPLLNKKFDVIHSPFSTPDNIKRVCYLSRMLNVPYTLSFRAHDIYGGFEESVKEKEYIVNASNIFMSANFYKPYINKKLEYGREIKVIHGGVDTEFFEPNGNKKRENCLISVCRFHEVKGVIYLLQACRILHERNIPFQCVLVGEGPEEKAYTDYIKLHNIPVILINRFLDRNGVKNELSRSEVFVLPCIVMDDGTHDILPNSVKEAMAMELPVVTSDIGGIGELVDDKENGFLVPSENPAAIADSIEWLFNNRKMMSHMGKNARKKILQDFNVKKEARKINSILKTSVSNKIEN